MEPSPGKGRFTFRTAAVFFFISAVLELLAATAPVPLFGAIREGVSAAIYHLTYLLLFIALGIGLWGAKPWGGVLVFAATALYTLDKLQLLLSAAATDAVVLQLQEALRVSMPDVERSFVSRTFVLVTVLFVLGWWGFALYTYWRRQYFKTGEGGEGVRGKE